MPLTFTGTKEMSDAIKQVAERYPSKVRGALYRIANAKILKPVQDVRIPVATGNAARSGHIVKYSDRLRMDVVFGGPVGGGGTNEKDANYVERLHEDDTLHHPPLHQRPGATNTRPGEAHFLQNQMLEESGSMLEDLTAECELAGTPTNWGEEG